MTKTSKDGHGRTPECRNVEGLFRDALNSPDETICSECVIMLHKIGSRKVLEEALRLLNSSSPRERQLAADVLGQLGVPTRTFPSECAEALLDLLNREEDGDVLEAIGVALGHLGDPRAVKPLTNLRAHSEANVRFGVVFGLLGHQDEVAIHALIELMRDPDPDVRDWATFGIGCQIESDTPEIREALVRALQDEVADVRAEAVMGLVNRKDSHALSAVIHELKQKDVGDLVLEAAIELAAPELVPALMDQKERCSNGPGDTLLEEAIDSCRRGRTPSSP